MKKITFLLLIMFVTTLGAQTLDFNGSNEGFTALTRFTATQKTYYLNLNTSGQTGINPAIRATATTPITTAGNNYAKITLRNSSPNGPTHIRFSIPQDGTDNPTANRTNFEVVITNNDKEFKTYYVELSGSTDWTTPATVSDFKLTFKDDVSVDYAVDGIDADIDIDKIEFTSEGDITFLGFGNDSDKDTNTDDWQVFNHSSWDQSNGIGDLVLLDNVFPVLRKRDAIDVSTYRYLHIRYTTDVNNRLLIRFNHPTTTDQFNYDLTVGASYQTETIDLASNGASGESIVEFRPRDTNDTDNSGSTSQSTAGTISFDYMFFSDSATPPDYVWNGSTDSDWATTTNWSPNGTPSSSDAVYIDNVANPPVIGSGTSAEVDEIFLINNASLTVNGGGSLSVTNDLNSDVGFITINSGGSLIVGGNSTGGIAYKRNLPTTNWYLISPPFDTETYDNIIQRGDLASGTAPNIGIAPYLNDGTGWDYKAETDLGDLGDGIGYSIKLAASGDVPFYGTMRTSDVGVAITSNTTAYNLVGNPYPSYIAANNDADATNNLLKVNDTDSDFLTEPTIWMWNGTTYDAYNHSTGSLHIAPGQGFFVSANGSNTFSITEAMQSHQSSDSFQKSATTRPEIYLNLSDGSTNRKAQLYYIEGVTKAFDDGYDSSLFGEGDNSLAIFTGVLQNSNGQKLQIQSLPNTGLEEMIIPVGINAQSGKEITISAEGLNIPDGLNLYLEDRDNGSFTELTATSNFTTTLLSDIDGIGRFYLHTKSSALSTVNFDMEGVSIYTLNKSTLRLEGLSQGTSKMKLYNILGKMVMATSFSTIGVEEISLPKLANGMYIVQLESDKGKLNKKIVLE